MDPVFHGPQFSAPPKASYLGSMRSRLSLDATGEATMQEQFVDRILTCVDCHGEFIFTAGEQLFFFDKQFKNDPKRCKPCKSRRSGLAAAANGIPGPAAAGLSRTETRTQCSDCGIETTVPFKPTQGRPVLCRQCFQLKSRAAAAAPPHSYDDAHPRVDARVLSSGSHEPCLSIGGRQRSSALAGTPHSSPHHL